MADASTEFISLKPLVSGPGQSKPLPTREVIRTPSPTPSENAVLTGGKRKRFEFKWNFRTIVTIFFVLVLATLLILLIAFREQIARALRPAGDWMERTPGGWLIPIAILIILSFPPLIGHEVVLIVVGFSWGLGKGFGIVSAGTFFGELATFYFFKFLCKGRQAQIEDNMDYALITRVLQDGGWKMVTIARYSAIPPHLLTALLSACGMDVWTFIVSALLSLPRQIAGVYLGYALNDTPGSDSTRTHKILQWIFVGITIATTVAAMRYIRRKQRLVASDIVYQRRKRRQARLQAEEDARVDVTEINSPSVDTESGIFAPTPRLPHP